MNLEEESRREEVQMINVQRNGHNESEEIDSVDLSEYNSLARQLKIPDSIKTPMPIYKYKQKRQIYFVDLVEDNVRNRFVFPLVALAFYITLVLTL